MTPAVEVSVMLSAKMAQVAFNDEEGEFPNTPEIFQTVSDNHENWELEFILDKVDDTIYLEFLTTWPIIVPTKPQLTIQFTSENMLLCQPIQFTKVGS